MTKHYSIGCAYRSGPTCTHPDQPHGARPSGGVCAKVCKLYDGPAATVEDKPVEPTVAKSKTVDRGCTPCAAAARARREAKARVSGADAAAQMDRAIREAGE